MKKLKFATIGCGRISYKHIEAIATNFEDMELVSICDIIKEKANEKARLYQNFIIGNSTGNEEVAITLKEDIGPKFRKVKIYTDYCEMLAKEDIDVVTITTESGYHAKHTIDCLNAGKHVIVEKPMALSTKDANDMIETAKENNLKLAVCHQNRFNPPIQKLRKAIEKGRFGKIVNGTARILWNRDNNYYNQALWRGTWELDGGTLMNQCIHNIDILQWMIGGEIESIYAQTGTFLRDIEAEDFGAIIIRFKNGSIGIVEGSACVYPRNLEETLSIFGEKGTVVIGGLAVNKIETWRFEDEKDDEYEVINECNEEVDNVYGKGHIELFKDFTDCIKEDREPLINGIEGKKAMEIVLGAYMSQWSNRKIHYPLKQDISTLTIRKS